MMARQQTPVDTPWFDTVVDGVPYQIQPLGAEQAFDLDAHLLHLFGEGLAALLASGLDGLMPALLLSVAKRFEEAQTMEQLRIELDEVLDLDLGSPEMREFIGRVILDTAPKIADLVRETIPTIANRITASQAKALVQICLFRHVKFKDPAGHWATMQSWQDLNVCLWQFPNGHKRQMHKWALLIRAIQVTWGPSGAAAPTNPVGERQEKAGPTSAPPTGETSA